MSAFYFGPLGSMEPVAVSAGVAVETARAQSEFVSSGGVRYVQRGRTAPRSWRVGRLWQGPDWARLLGLAAHGLLPQCWFYDVAAARENMIPAHDTAGLWTHERRNLATNPRFAGTTSTSPLPTPLQVRAGSFNMRLASMNDPGDHAWASRKSAFAASVVSSGAHIVGLQEVSWVTDPVNSQAVAAVEEVNAQLGAAKWSTVGALDGSNAIAWDTTKLDRLSEPVTIPVNVEYVVGATRTMLWARFRDRASGQEFLFANTHWQHDDPDVANGRLRRQESAMIVADYLDRLRASTGIPAVLTADFNDASEAAGTPRAFLASRGYVTTRSLASSPANNTLNSYNGFDQTMTGKQNGNWMDGVLISTGLTVDGAGLVADFADGAALPLRTPLPSDHNMVWGGIQILNASTVTRQGGGGALTTGGSAKAYQSFVNGAPALTVEGNGGSASATSVYLAGPVSGAAGRLGLEVGKTYTVSVDCIIPVGLGDSTSTWARRIVVSAGTGTQFGLSPQAPTGAGRTRLAVTFTVPAEAADNASIRLYHGYSSGLIHWANLLIEEAPRMGEYGDGDKAGWSWDGARNASTSTGQLGPAQVPVAGQNLSALKYGHRVQVPLLRGHEYTVSVWTLAIGNALSYTLGDDAPAYLSSSGPVAHKTFTAPADVMLTVEVTAPTNTAAGLRVHEGPWDATFYASHGTPCRVSVTDPERTLQMLTDETRSDYQVTLMEVGKPGTH